MSELYDLAIVGGGPAGAAAAVYAARKRIKSVFLTKEWGGQSIVSPEIQNWIGTPAISGTDLAANMRKHVETYAGDVLKIVAPADAASIEPKDDRVAITLKNGDVYEARTVLIATGSQRRKLAVPGANEFEQKGITYCASCDGALFAGMDVAVIGGGNAAFESALQLAAYCSHVTILVRSDIRADEITVNNARAAKNITILTNAETTAVKGDGFVNGLTWKDAAGTETLLPVSGIFVEIGHIPNTAWLGTAVELTAAKEVKADPYTQRTSHQRIWAAGDCADGLFKQNNIAVGDAIKALEDIHKFLQTK